MRVYFKENGLQTETITVKASKKFKQQVEKRAKKLGLTKSAYIKQLIEMELKNSNI